MLFHIHSVYDNLINNSKNLNKVKIEHDFIYLAHDLIKFTCSISEIGGMRKFILISSKI